MLLKMTNGYVAFGANIVLSGVDFEINKGESANCSMSIKVADLAFFNEEINDWEVEDGDYTFKIGFSSRNILKEIPFKITH